ncbi:glycoside hydrolase family 2 protein [Paenibacillus thalictri]|uniref:Glycoside hydrolase family 2 n=1 Tax=Paenibacillus thalictri TaxID=2527873 RepID=A0A4Q9DV63_9BACL|nr:sugar-binding domain-containing protein [Paenibacillus thalictri]TBL79488.1 glycoside hydrolase family 2 [Paenibacillus thalictri]
MPQRMEYPRPQFVRNDWLNLNGEWEFAFDDENTGEREAWFEDGKQVFDKRIQVPFCFQSELSGIGETGFHDIVWYRKAVTLPPEFADKSVLLHFGAVDYEASVWVNGRLVATHTGGHTPFSADVTSALRDGENAVVVRARDYSKDMTLPRGKQFWEEKSRGIFYTRTTGIWQTVWMEPVEALHIDKVKLTPDIDKDQVGVRVFVNGSFGQSKVQLKTIIRFADVLISEDVITLQQNEESRHIRLYDTNGDKTGRKWTPERPNLYDIEWVLLVDGVEADHVQSYFGMRKISVEDGVLCLNNRPYYMKLVLDQGYFPEGLLTAPSDDALRADVEYTKAMGFNGARKHQKVEDPRYLYWCDKLGLLVWGEMANAYIYSEQYVSRMTSEWVEAVERDYNHPCVVAWVPLNESWGVPNILVDKAQQDHALAMYYLTKSLDPTRPVISNDGWEHVKSDLCTIHDYESSREVLAHRYGSADTAVSSKPGKRWIYVPGYARDQEPILVTEFGGISFRKSEWEGWGYSAAESDGDFVSRLAAVVHPLLESPIVQGFCYTQLTDVEQEINGLLTYDRKPKVPLEWIKAINEGKLPDMKS